MTVAISVQEVPVGSQLTNKHLVNDQIWDRLVSRIVKDENMERLLAERVMNEALGFLQLCAQVPNGNFSPSSLVDIGWHTFILYTRHYAAFCQGVGADFIHHEPSDAEGVDYGSGNTVQTVAAMQIRGIAVDTELWPSTAECQGSKCYSCSNGGCRMNATLF